MKINDTRDFSQFGYYSSNRSVKTKKILESITQKNMLHAFPIVVRREDEKLMVIDGQHRCKAAESLGVKIYYIQVDDLDESDIWRCQIQSNWTLDQFLHYYKGINDDYKFVEEIIKETTFPINFIINNSSQAVNGTKSFRKGIFSLKKNRKKIKENFINMKEIIDVINDAIPKKETEKSKCIYMHHTAMNALWTIVNDKTYNHEKMLAKCEKFWDNFLTSIKWKEQRDILHHLKQDVYLFRSKNKHELEDEMDCAA